MFPRRVAALDLPIKLSVDATGAPKLEFLDETGKVTYSLPQDSKVEKK